MVMYPIDGYQIAPENCSSKRVFSYVTVIAAVQQWRRCSNGGSQQLELQEGKKEDGEEEEGEAEKEEEEEEEDYPHLLGFLRGGGYRRFSHFIIF